MTLSELNNVCCYTTDLTATSGFLIDFLLTQKSPVTPIEQSDSWIPCSLEIVFCNSIPRHWDTSQHSSRWRLHRLAGHGCDEWLDQSSHCSSRYHINTINKVGTNTTELGRPKNFLKTTNLQFICIIKESGQDLLRSFWSVSQTERNWAECWI